MKITDPTTHFPITAPYIKYHLSHLGSCVSATYGQGYPITTRTLRPIPVDYLCPAITPSQMALLDADAPFAPVVQSFIANHFPLDISNTISQYQLYRQRQLEAQRQMRKLRVQEGRFLELAMENLSDLENTNVLGRLLCYSEDIMQSLSSVGQAQFLAATAGFTGAVTQSALDATPNLHHPLNVSRHLQYLNYQAQKEAAWEAKKQYHIDQEARKYAEAQEIEDRLRARQDPKKRRRQGISPPRFALTTAPRTLTTKKCHRCQRIGHIRANCPYKPVYAPEHKQRKERAKL
jgi:hypothetical protein